MTVKIISDGTPYGTKVINSETGELVENVQSISWNITSSDLFSSVILEISIPEIELTTEATLVNHTT